MSQNPINIGPLEPLLADPDITAIHIDTKAVRYVKAGIVQTSEIRFESDDQRRAVIESILAAGGQYLSASQPKVETFLSDGTHVRAEHDPLTLSLYKRKWLLGEFPDALGGTCS